MSEFVSAFKGESGGWNEEKWAYQYPEVCPVLWRHVFVLLRTDVMMLQMLINIKPKNHQLSGSEFFSPIYIFIGL